MKLLITGGDGQLGRELRRVLARGQADIGDIPACYNKAEVLSTDADRLDITDPAAVDAFLRAERPDIVFNCAAYTQVDACEQDEATADRINHDGARHLAESAARIGAKLVHISTDYVFAGDGQTPYKETDPPAPATAYGRTKRRGELAVEAVGGKFFILRTAWLYGAEGGNFVRTIRRLGESRDSVTVVNDQTGSPTYAEDLAWTMLALAATDAYGVYHVTGDGSCTWYEFAREILRRAGSGCRVIPCTSAEYPSSTPRPAYSVLAHEALRAVGLDRMRPWKQALEAYFSRTEELA